MMKENRPQKEVIRKTSSILKTMPTHIVVSSHHNQNIHFNLTGYEHIYMIIYTHIDQSKKSAFGLRN